MVIYCFFETENDKDFVFFIKYSPFLKRKYKIYKEKIKRNIFAQPFNDRCPSHIETSQLICRTNQLSGFCLKGILVVKGLNQYN